MDFVLLSTAGILAYIDCRVFSIYGAPRRVDDIAIPTRLLFYIFCGSSLLHDANFFRKRQELEASFSFGVAWNTPPRINRTAETSRVFADNLVGSGFSYSVSYSVPGI